MAVNDKKARNITRTLREPAKDHTFKDQGLNEIIKEATNPYQMLQAINYSGRVNHTESFIMSRAFLHIDVIARLADQNKAADEVEALVAAFKCLLNNMKAREMATGSLFLEDKEVDAEWEMVEKEDGDEFVVIEEDLGA